MLKSLKHQPTLLEELTKTQTLLSLGYVAAMVLAAVVLSGISLPKSASRKHKNLFIWLVFDGICHLSLEGSFLYLSTFGRSVNKSNGFFAYLWQEYSKADARWGFSDPNVVSLEILTVLLGGPIALYSAYLLARGEHGKYHFWAISLSVAELYGGFMTFSPEWLTGMKYLDGSTPLLFWGYLMGMNLVWVFIPFYILYDSYGAVVKSLKITEGKKNK